MWLSGIVLVPQSFHGSSPTRAVVATIFLFIMHGCISIYQLASNLIAQPLDVAELSLLSLITKILFDM